MPRRKKDEEVPLIVILIAGIGLVIYGVIYAIGFIFSVIIKFISDNWIYFLIIGVGILTFFVVREVKRYKKTKLEEELAIAEALEKEKDPTKGYFSIEKTELEYCTAYFYVGKIKPPYDLFAFFSHNISGDFVAEDQKIIELYSFQPEFKIELLSPKSGIIEFFLRSQQIANDCKKRINEENEKIFLFAIYQNQNDRLKEKFSNSSFLIEDKFAGEKTLGFQEIGSLNKKLRNFNFFEAFDIVTEIPIFSFHPFDKVFFNESFHLTIENIADYDYLTITYHTSDYKLGKNDKLLFLLENNEVLTFEALGKPFTIIKGRIKGYRFPIFFEDINLLKFNKVEKVRLILSQENYYEDFETCENGDNKDHFQFIIQNLFNQYSEAVEKNIPDYKPISRKNITPVEPKTRDDSCFVYLMVDLVNNYHKIGISNAPGYREKTLQSEKPTIELIAQKRYPSRKIAESIERALHNTFSEKHVRGEWFNLSAGDVSEVVETLK